MAEPEPRPGLGVAGAMLCFHLTGCRPQHARLWHWCSEELLEDLVDAGLLAALDPGCHRLHDLAWLYAETAPAEPPRSAMDEVGGAWTHRAPCCARPLELLAVRLWVRVLALSRFNREATGASRRARTAPAIQSIG